MYANLVFPNIEGVSYEYATHTLKTHEHELHSVAKTLLEVETLSEKRSLVAQGNLCMQDCSSVRGYQWIEGSRV